MKQRSSSAEIARLIEESRALRERSRSMIDECRKQMTHIEDPVPDTPSSADFVLSASDEDQGRDAAN